MPENHGPSSGASSAKYARSRGCRIEEHRTRREMTAFSHHFVESNGIRMHYVEAGAGPLVVLCHGFPESWYSWRHQLAALAEAGFHAVAPDQRGYGQTDKPEAVDAYSVLHLAGYIVGLVNSDRKSVV